VESNFEASPVDALGGDACFHRRFGIRAGSIVLWRQAEGVPCGGMLRVRTKKLSQGLEAAIVGNMEDARKSEIFV
jgi:hypothetical protein